jgi:hypothetical protein
MPVKLWGRSQAWWFMLVTPALGKLRQESQKFKASLRYISRFCLKTTKRKKKHGQEDWCLEEALCSATPNPIPRGLNRLTLLSQLLI